MRIEEFNSEKEWWENRESNEFAWRVQVEDIVASGYNLDIKNPHSVDDGPCDPDELLEMYKQAVTAMEGVRNALKTGLIEALGKE